MSVSDCQGYEIPLHRSLAEPIWMAGHSLAVLMARSDPDFLAVAIRSVRHREHLSC